MIKIDKEFLAQIVENIWQSKSQIIELRSSVPEIIRNINSSIGEIESIDISEKYLSKIIELLRQEIIEAQKLDLTPNYEFSGHSEDRLLRFSFIKQENPILISKLEYRNDIFNSLKDLPWQSFEKICAFLLKQLGVTTHHTKLTRDGGVDFCGIIKLTKYIGFISNFEVKIFGEAKKRATDTILIDEIDAFIRRYNEIKTGTGPAHSKLPQWFKTSKGQIFGVFVTNTNFEPGAIKSASREGIIILNGQQLSEEIAKLDGIFPWFYYANNQPGAPYIFDKKKFLEFFKKQT